MRCALLAVCLLVVFSAPLCALATKAASGTARVLRGGSWVAYPLFCRSADREWGYPGDGDDCRGFRCARDLAAIRPLTEGQP